MELNKGQAFIVTLWAIISPTRHKFYWLRKGQGMAKAIAYRDAKQKKIKELKKIIILIENS